MWFITVMEKCEPDEQFLANLGDKRTWGYFKDHDTAVQALHENWTDMWEFCYDYAVLEKADEGICPNCGERQWFKFDREHNGYFEIEEPECVKHICNFALG